MKKLIEDLMGKPLSEIQELYNNRDIEAVRRRARMYHDKALQESIKKVEAARAENVKLEPRRMTAEEKDALLKTYPSRLSRRTSSPRSTSARTRAKRSRWSCAALLEGTVRVSRAATST